MIKLNTATIETIKKAIALEDLNPITYDKEELLEKLDSEVSEDIALALVELIDDKKEEYGFQEDYSLTLIGQELTFARDYIGSQLFN